MALAMIETTTSFSPSHGTTAKGGNLFLTNMNMSSGNNGDNNNDPTDNFATSIANSIQNIFTNFSPLNDAKKKLVQSLAGKYDKQQIRNELQSLIDNEPVLMLSFTKWPFCIKAKQILDNKKPNGITYKVLELDVLSNGYAFRAEMAELIDRTSVPAIWINGDFIGGCNDGGMDGEGLVQLDVSGKLDILLKDAGAI